MELTDTQKALFDAMTKLQQNFALGIVKGLNQIDAYRAAGGKAKTEESAHASASEILSNPKVKAFLDAISEAAISDAVMTRKEALERLTSLGRANLSDLVEFSEQAVGEDEEGNPVIQATWKFKDSALQSPVSLSAIQELTVGKRGISIKLHDPKAAIRQLSDLEGWDAPKKTELAATLTMNKSLSELFEDDDA